jgi:hypothetical protein
MALTLSRRHPVKVGCAMAIPTPTTAPTPTAATAGGDRDEAAATESASGAGDNDGGAPGSDADSATTLNGVEQSEDLLGINPEAASLVMAAVLGSVLLAAALLSFDSPLLAAGTSLIMVAFTALDPGQAARSRDEHDFPYFWIRTTSSVSA